MTGNDTPRERPNGSAQPVRPAAAPTPIPHNDTYAEREKAWDIWEIAQASSDQADDAVKAIDDAIRYLTGAKEKLINTAFRLDRAVGRAAAAAIPENDLCAKSLHKACRCVRLAGHDGPCNCAYPDGRAAT